MRKSSEILEGAIEVLDEHGWQQGDYGDEENGFCVLGAMARSYVGANYVPMYGEPLRYLVGALDVVQPWQVADWNDKPGRTKEEVIEALTLAAKAAREAGE